MASFISLEENTSFIKSEEIHIFPGFSVNKIELGREYEITYRDGKVIAENESVIYHFVINEKGLQLVFLQAKD